MQSNLVLTQITIGTFNYRGGIITLEIFTLLQISHMYLLTHPNKTLSVGVFRDETFKLCEF